MRQSTPASKCLHCVGCAAALITVINGSSGPGVFGMLAVVTPQVLAVVPPQAEPQLPAPSGRLCRVGSGIGN